MSDEWKDGYQQGFKDGYELGKKVPNPIWDNKPYCRVCGMDFSKPMAYSCFNDRCPTKITCSTDRIVENVGHIKTFSTLFVGNNTVGQFSISDLGLVTDGLSYEEIYGSVIYQQNNKKEE